MAYCYDGKTYETIKEMAEEYGIDRQRIYSFRRRGWSLEDAMQMCINDVRGRGRLFEYKRYGAEVSGFQFGKVAEMQANGQKDPQELRGFLNDVRQVAYTIRNHMERNFGEQEQTFSKDDFSFEEPPKQAPKKEKKEKQPER